VKVHLEDILEATLPKDLDEKRSIAKENLPKLKEMVDASSFKNDKEFCYWLQNVCDYYMANVCLQGRRCREGD
jgi:hypothetical protein